MLKKLKALDWDRRVTRQGHLQPKAILCESIILPIKLTNNITIKNNNSAWIHNLNIYENNNYKKEFKDAFKENKDFPLDLISLFNNLTIKKNTLIKKLSTHSIQNFLEYSELLKQIQKFYVIAVPLTNFCEKELKLLNIDPKLFAVPHQKLDIESNQHLPWLKTFYNIVEQVNKDKLPILKKHTIPEKPKNTSHLIQGLQIAIFIRNRIKELSQQLWFAIDPLASSLANQLNMKKQDFFHLTVQEIIASLKNNKSIIKSEELKKRKECFIVGQLDSQGFLLSGNEAKEIVKAFEITHNNELKGTIACQGKAKGNIKIINNIKESHNFQKGDILVTTMTTPDFLPLMAKASAIITDEGGLSCHAAIVSRELNIPCIIGTNNATKLLKNNKIVEVDAINNQIKVL